MIVYRCGKHRHFRVLQFGIDLLHIVFLCAYAMAFPMAVFAGTAPFYVHLADAEHFDNMAALFGGFLKGRDHASGVTLRSGTTI